MLEQLNLELPNYGEMEKKVIILKLIVSFGVNILHCYIFSQQFQTLISLGFWNGFI
jgi:hypothetical protein